MTRRPAWRSGLEMLVGGGLVDGAAFPGGWLLESMAADEEGVEPTIRATAR